MKTNKRRFLAALTASTLALTPCFAAGTMTAFAANHNLTINNATGDTATHTYNAYQIIIGTKAADGTLSNMQWGANVDSTKFVAALTAKATDLGIDSTKLGTIEGVAAELASIRDDADKVEMLAKIFNAEGTESVLKGSPTSLTAGTATSVADGWYLIKDESTLNNETGPKVRSANLLQIVGDTTVSAKNSLPSIDKVIDDGSTDGVEYNTGAVGDVVQYKITSAVPDVTGYNKYFFIIDDKLSDGLTFEAADKAAFAVTIGGSTLATDKYSVTFDDAEKTFKLVFKNCVTNFDGKAGQPIVVSYQATLNSDIDVSQAGNTNESKLTYSNDPNIDSDGNGTSHPDEPKPEIPDNPETPENEYVPGDATGETPWDKVVTYSTQIELTKVDNAGAALKGAEFTLTSDNGTMMALKSTVSFEEDSAGEYYLLTDGTYTKTPPVTSGDGANSDKYQDTSKLYKKTTTFTLLNNATSGVDIKGTVADDGTLTFRGLEPGIYTLSETVTPTGYNTISDIEFTIGGTPSTTGCEWTFSTSNASVTNKNVSQGDSTTDSKISFNVVNIKGSVLPETGGMGTKLFYVFGSLFVIGGATFMVTKKRVGNSK